MAAGGEVGGGGGGFGGEAGDVGHRARAVGGGVEAHSDTCGAWRAPRLGGGGAGRGPIGLRVRAVAAAAHLFSRQKKL
jgi:hypothetical protein